MPDTVKRTEHIWVFGKKEDFAIYDCGVALDSRQYQQAGGSPAKRQKNQIVLHFTAGNGPGSGTVSWWNMIAPLDSDLFYCPKYFEVPHHYSSATAGSCPDGHGALKHLPNRASAHYVVERAAHRAVAARPYVDVIEVVESDNVTWHGEIVNTNSIGIEHANIGTAWAAAANDVFTGAGADKRPTDQNHWLHLDNPSRPNSNLSSHDFQAYEEEQYLAMTMLLRYLCMKHRIPRRFLGDTTDEKMARWWHERDALTRSRLMRFRGILSHMNCHKDKECGGPAMHRNRLFRGIADEWWLPVEVDGAERPYYMGPFDPQANAPSYFRWRNSALTAELFHDADLDALQDTRSYYDLDRLWWYYAKTEDPKLGGTFPIGTNKIWHGGVHFASPANNPKVYAAAAGRVVAARLGSDAAIEADKDLGSQRFVLIRHCVYWQQQADPGGGERTDYTTDPSYFFTLYMHLAPVADLNAANNQNPPWFNYWLRHRAAAADPNAVFCPDAPVLLGDWIGNCGTFRNSQMLHFEVVSKDELSVDPWNDPSRKIVDNDSNLICDSAALDKFVSGARINTLDILRAAPDLRKVKSYHKSEWALADENALLPVLPDAAARKNYWNKLKFFMWVADAVAACPDLSAQLCDATGMMWHYHPVTFMDFVNKLVLRENGQVAEPDYSDTNVTMQDEFLTSYVSFASGSSTPAAADGQHVRPFSVSAGAFEYHFTRKELACRLAAPHDPADDPPKETRFHISLLDVLENIREEFGSGINVSLAHVCPAHNIPANVNACVTGAANRLDSHASGLAVDIRPGSASQASVKQLWKVAKNAAGLFQTTCGEHSGEPSHGELQGHAQMLDVVTSADAEVKLTAGTNLTPAELAAFTIHLEIFEYTKMTYWVAWLRSGTLATDVRIETGDLVGTFWSKIAADSERAPGTPNAAGGSGGFDCIIKKGTKAAKVAIRPPGIVGFFVSVADAEAEKVMGDAWPEES